SAAVPENPIFPLPTLEPVPAAVTGMDSFVLSLDGPWKVNRTPAAQYWNNEVDPAAWADAAVPVRFNRTEPRATQPYAYKRKFTVPADFAGKRTILRFDGVSCDAQVWINGRFVREHWGTFMAWSCDVTDFVKPGTEAWVTVGVDDRPTGLAQFLRPGGLIRDVSLFAVPADHLTRFQVETTFDGAFQDAVLHVRLRGAVTGAAPLSVKLRLKNADGGAVALAPDTVDLSAADPEKVLSIPVPHPRKWDAEHPFLYTLDAVVQDSEGLATETLSRKVGFREVKVVGNRMLVNGREVKLRGIWGGPDAAGLKAINVNHTRQKYASESFLDDADRLGLYVLDEVPVDFAKYGVETDPQYAAQWLGLIAELMERDRNHPSVVIWGLGNESFNGPNVLKTFHFVQAEDAQRPAMFSWANRVKPEDELPYSIASVHYPNLNDPTLDLGGYNVAVWHSPSLVRERKPPVVMPVLQDEYAHVILNEALIIRDPNVRNFWGESIYRFWEKIFTTPGALGGDQFGMGLRLGRGNLPNGPEFFLLKEAYSPVRIENQPLANPEGGNPLPIGIRNWYDHTNLSELRVRWIAGDARGEMAGPSLEPHASGTLTLPARNWRDGDFVQLTFTDASGLVVNEFRLAINPPKPVNPVPSGTVPRLELTPSEILISGSNFKVVFDRYRGLIKEASVEGKNVIIDGPFLTLMGSGLAYGE
ncbi:MAG TPA: glycoside hydrolase family 2 TIM barrel-domain containing protein, partial [Opitutaceae bacterium]